MALGGCLFFTPKEFFVLKPRRSRMLIRETSRSMEIV